MRKLLYCERCDARMHGQKGSSPQVRRYMCSTRRYGGACEQPITKAEPLEAQIVEWLRGFQPDEELRAVVLASLQRAAKREGGDGTRRKELGGQLERLRELYVMGDLTKDEYEIRCQASCEELERIGPPLDPQIERADAILRDFASFWEVEPKATERRKLISSLFGRVWQDEGRIVAVKPREPFLRYFQLADEVAQLRTGVNRGSKGGGGQTRKTTRKSHDHAAGQ